MPYGTATPFVISPANLADWAGAAAAPGSEVVDFAAIAGGTFSDILVFGQTKLVAGSPSNFKSVGIYAYASLGDGVYPDEVTGSDAGITTNNPPQLKRIGAILTPAGNVAYRGGPWSLRAHIAGTPAAVGGIVLINMSGLALSGTAGDHVFKYQIVP